MKKLFFIMMVIGIAFTSCKKSDVNQVENDPQATEEGVTNADSTAVTASLADIVAQAKAEGANWSVDEWKEQVKKALIVYKPLSVATDELGKRLANGEDFDFEAEAKKLEDEYPNYGPLIREFIEVARQSENGKAVVDDEEWTEQIMEELGVPTI